MPDPLRIIKLSVSNFKNLRAIDITPKGSVVRVTGKNSAGKSSVLDAIQSALAGKDAVPSEPLRRGQSKGGVVLTMSNGWEVHETFTEAGRYLKVIKEGGEAFKSPQAMLDELGTSGLLFDPLEFTRQKPQDQAATLLRLAGVDLTKIKAKRDDAYAERTVINRQLKEAQAVLAEKKKAVGDPISEAEAAEAADLLKQINEANADLAEAERAAREAVSVANAKVAMVNTIDQNYQERSAEIAQEIARLQKKQKELDAQHFEASAAATTAADNATEARDEALQAVDETKAARDELAAGIDIEDLKKTVTQSSASSETRAAAKAQAEIVNKLDSQSTALTKAIEASDAAKAKMLAEAKLPIDGLIVDTDGVVRFNGTPLDQAAMNEKMKVSIAVGMAMQKPGGLHVMLARDGSLLDQDSIAMLTEWSELHGWQIWLEETTDGEDIAGAVVIEAGELKE